MRLQNIHGFANIDEYVRYKLSLYSKKEKTFETLFEFMFDESDNTMVETTDGYRINKVTYGDFKKQILDIMPTVANAFSDLPKGEMIGLYMANCPEWIALFWAILGAGYRPLLMNTRLSDEVLNSILLEYSVKGVISDGKSFAVKTVMKEDALVPSKEEFISVPFGKEVLFMSSGTSEHIKLCAYTGENFYYQVCDSANIVSTCPDIRNHYEGELKQLMLLPLCHVFGFIAVYLWFGFFSRTFVFPRDLNPSTIQRTVKKHKVTHIFAVPMVWEAVAKAALSKIKARGDKTYNKFKKVTGIVNSLGGAGDLIAKYLLSEVREGLFGDSIKFMISGGSEISGATLSFFNGIGYHLANGYGMTEIGITSVEKARSKKILNSASIGAPFGNTEYSLDEKGTLLVRGKTRASRILCDGKETIIPDEEWFSTGDRMGCENGRYYAQGRADDLIICEDGENLNPCIAESSLCVEGIDKLCVFKDTDNKVAVVASIPGCYVKNRLSSLHDALSKAIAEAKLDRVIARIYFTNESLLKNDEIKLARKKIVSRINSGQIKVFDPANLEERTEELLEGLEKDLQECFAQVLSKDPSQIGKNSHFFRDLDGTSIDYYSLLGTIRERMGVNVVNNDTLKLSTVSEFAEYLQNKNM